MSLTAAAYKLVWLRLFLFVALPWLVMFIAETEDYSTQAWAELGAFRKNRIYAKCLVPGLIAFVAFLDKSMQRGDERYVELKGERKVEDLEDKAVALAERTEEREEQVAEATTQARIKSIEGKSQDAPKSELKDKPLP